MKANKFLSISVIALIVINLILITFIWFRRPERIERAREPRLENRMVIRRLHFDSTQADAYKKLFDQFRSAQRENSDNIYQCKRLLHESIYNHSVNSDSLLQVIGDLEREHEAATYSHLKKVYNICNEDQKKMFGQLMEETIRYRGRERQRRFHPHGR